MYAYYIVLFDHVNQVQFAIMIICMRSAVYGQHADSHTVEPS